MPGSEDLLQRCCPPECPLAPLGCIFYFCCTFVTDNLPDNHTTPHWLSCFLLLAATVPSSDGQLQDGVLLVISAPYPNFLRCSWQHLISVPLHCHSMSLAFLLSVIVIFFFGGLGQWLSIVFHAIERVPSATQPLWFK